jgi:membrane-bound serine protease (ClpP class)
VPRLLLLVALGLVLFIAAETPALVGAEELGTAALEVRAQAFSPADQLIGFLVTPAVAGLLFALGLLLVLADLVSAGFGLTGLLGVGLLALFFWAHMLAGTAGWEGAALVTIGLLLVAAELLVIPGFGVAGMLGLLALGAGLFLSVTGGRVVSSSDLARVTTTLGIATAGFLGGAVLLLRYLPRLGRLHGLILQAQVGIPGAVPTRQRWPWLEGARLEAHSAHEAENRASLLGATGVAASYLRPGGIADIEGTRVDVVTEGEYIPAGAPIEIIADEGYRRVVRRLHTVLAVRQEGDSHG